MKGSEFYPATLRVAVLWGGGTAEDQLLAIIKFLLAHGVHVDVGALPGEPTGHLQAHKIAYHTDNSYLGSFISEPGCKCFLCGTREHPTAKAILELGAKYGVPALDVAENVPLNMAAIMASCVANGHPEPRTVTADGRPLFPDMGYERYTRLMGISQEVTRDIEGAFSLLDIGGEDKALQNFLPQATYENYDGIISRDHSTELPANHYDVVVASDVLEHVLPEERSAFITELVRLARRRVVLSFPGAQAGIHEQFVLGLFPNHRWLVEHQENGLPLAADVEKLLHELDLAFVRIPNHSLQNWVYSVLFDVIPLAKDLRRALNLFLQEFTFAMEQVEPSYRYIYVIEK